MAFKGELFSQDMVRAYLEKRKLHTCRPAKIEFLPGFNPEWTGYRPVYEYGEFFLEGSNHQSATRRTKPKYKPGDYLYVQETWKVFQIYPSTLGFDVIYRADEYINPCIFKDMDRYFKFQKYEAKNGWQSPYFMPREAARLCGRVTKVEAMRLDDVDEQFAQEDGFLTDSNLPAAGKFNFFWQTQYGPAARWMWVYWTVPVSKEEAIAKADT